MTIQETHYNEQNPVVVVYCYRWMDSAQIHALSVELWFQGQKLAYIKPIQIAMLYQFSLSRISATSVKLERIGTKITKAPRSSKLAIE